MTTAVPLVATMSSLDKDIRTEIINQCLELQNSIYKKDQKTNPTDKEYGSKFDFPFIQFYHTIIVVAANSQLAQVG